MSERVSPTGSKLGEILGSRQSIPDQLLSIGGQNFLLVLIALLGHAEVLVDLFKVFQSQLVEHRLQFRQIDFQRRGRDMSAL